MRAILLCGKHNLKENISLKKTGKNYLIDLQINALKLMNFDVTVVLDKYFADEILSKSKTIKLCDFVYDTNDENSSIYSNIKSALYSVDTLAFALPVYAPIPSSKHWNIILNNNFINAYNGKHIVQTQYKSQDDELRPGYPIFITKRGYEFIKESKGITSLEDSKLNKSHYIIEDNISNFSRNLVSAYIDNSK